MHAENYNHGSYKGSKHTRQKHRDVKFKQLQSSEISEDEEENAEAAGQTSQRLF